MSGLIIRRENFKTLMSKHPEIVEVDVNKDFDFRDSSPELYIRGKTNIEVLKLLNDLTALFGGEVKLRVSYSPEDLMFQGRKVLYLKGKMYDN